MVSLFLEGHAWDRNWFSQIYRDYKDSVSRPQGPEQEINRQGRGGRGLWALPLHLHVSIPTLGLHSCLSPSTALLSTCLPGTELVLRGMKQELQIREFGGFYVSRSRVKNVKATDI